MTNEGTESALQSLILSPKPWRELASEPEIPSSRAFQFMSKLRSVVNVTWRDFVLKRSRSLETLVCFKNLKGQFTQKWKFCHHLLTLKYFQTCMNVFVLLNTKEDILKNEGNRAVLDQSIFFPTMEVNGAPKQPDYKLSSEYLPLCSAEQRHSYRFGSTWGWVNDNRINIFGWTVPLKSLHKHLKVMCLMNWTALKIHVFSTDKLEKPFSLSHKLTSWLNGFIYSAGCLFMKCFVPPCQQAWPPKFGIISQQTILGEMAVCPVNYI